MHPQTQTRLYRIAPGTNAVSVIDATLSEPNGVTLSLDESTLYVTSNNGIYRYPVRADGSTGTGVVFVQGVTGDGMTIDCAGNLYVAVVNTPNVVVLSPAGAQLGQLSVPTGSVQAVTNAAFGGPDHKTLYITALGSGMQKSLFQIALSVPGMPY
jgi:gluconolactonase